MVDLLTSDDAVKVAVVSAVARQISAPSAITPESLARSVLIGAIEIADRHCAAQRAEQVDRGAGFHAGAHGAALLAAAVELLIVDARILLHFHERLDAGVETEADARDAGILVEIAIGIVRSLAVGQHGILVLHAVEVPLSDTIRRLKFCTTPSVPPSGVDRQFGETGRKVGAAGIVGRHQEAVFENDLGVAGDVDAAVESSSSGMDD